MELALLVVQGAVVGCDLEVSPHLPSEDPRERLLSLADHAGVLRRGAEERAQLGRRHLHAVEVIVGAPQPGDDAHREVFVGDREPSLLEPAREVFLEPHPHTH